LYRRPARLDSASQRLRPAPPPARPLQPSHPLAPEPRQLRHPRPPAQSYPTVAPPPAKRLHHRDRRGRSPRPLRPARPHRSGAIASARRGDRSRCGLQAVLVVDHLRCAGLLCVRARDRGQGDPKRTKHLFLQSSVCCTRE
jgi:hypothetical protein